VTYDDLQRLERDSILAALKQTEWKISGHGGAAELLGIKPTTLSSRMKKMDIKRPV
jgi:transcriptional regulator with GAF, ATPase, and Fis domain